MSKKISVSELRSGLTSLLDQLDQGQSHFVVERNNREVAVLLSMEKFQDIMQMLELLNTLDFIETGSGQDFLEGLDTDFPDLTLLPSPAESPTPPEAVTPPRRHRNSSSIEAMANKLGIRVIK